MPVSQREEKAHWEKITPARNDSFIPSKMLGMPPATDNPFAALTVIVAPAVLTNATSILTFVTSNRYIVLLDRWRVVAQDIQSLPEDAPDRVIRVNHVDRLEKRAQMLLRALRGLFLTIGLFAMSALVALVGSSLALRQVGVATLTDVALALGIGAVISLVYALWQLACEATLSSTHVRDEALILKVRSENPPTGI